MNRREAIRQTAILMGGAISGSAMLGVLNGCKAEPTGSGWKPTWFTSEEGDLLMHLTERIIPKTDTPGANDAGVHSFIDLMMKEFYGEKEKTTFREGLKRVNADAKAAHGKVFAALKPEQQDELLKKYDQEAYDEAQQNDRPQDAPPHFFRTTKELTLLGFFTSEPGATEVLNYDPVPGVYKGCIPYAEVGKAWAT